MLPPQEHTISGHESSGIHTLLSPHKESIEIDLSSIRSVKKVMYSKYILNRSVYNLHLKGTIRFYTRGADAVELIDKDGLIYLIGSQKSEELARVVYQELNKK